MKISYKTLLNGAPIEEIRDVNFSKSYDLIVCGGGTAGVSAALTALKFGLKVAVIESKTALGGTSTIGGVWPYYFGRKCYGMIERDKKIEDLAKLNIFADIAISSFDKGRKQKYSGALTLIADENVLNDANCDVYLDSRITGVYTKNNQVIGIEYFNCNTLISLGAKVVLDCADGFVSKLAHCKLSGGRQSDGKNMLFSRYIARGVSGKLEGEAAHCGSFSGKLGEFDQNVLSSATKSPCLKPSYSCENRVVFHSSILGERSVNRVQTMEQSTLEDWFINYQNNCVYTTFSHLDNAYADFYNEDRTLQKWNFLINAHAIGIDFGVKLGSLITAKYKNLFLAGKHIGVDYSSVGFIRMKSDVERCGEVCAIMANAYINSGEVSYDEIKDELNKRNLIVGGSERILYNLNIFDGKNYKSTAVKGTREEIIDYLSSDFKEYGYICALTYKNSQELIKYLLNEYKRHPKLKCEIAISLALLGSESSLPMLREIINGEATLFVRKDEIENAYPWLKGTVHYTFAKALCLLCDFGDRECYERIKQIYENNAVEVTKNVPFPYIENYKKLILGYAKKYLNQFGG